MIINDRPCLRFRTITIPAREPIDQFIPRSSKPRGRNRAFPLLAKQADCAQSRPGVSAFDTREPFHGRETNRWGNKWEFVKVYSEPRLAVEPDASDAGERPMQFAFRWQMFPLILPPNWHTEFANEIRETENGHRRTSANVGRVVWRRFQISLP